MDNCTYDFPGTTQACLFRDSYTLLTVTGFSIFGLSPDSPKSNTLFKEKQKLPYTLLCDPSQTLILAIGMNMPPQSTARGVFVVDKGGKVLAAETGGPAATVEVVKRLVEDSGARQEQDALGRIIVGFSRDGMFPEEDEVSAMHVQSSALPAAINALAAAKTDLEVSFYCVCLQVQQGYRVSRIDEVHFTSRDPH